MLAIDLGSNTLRIVVYDCNKQKTTFIYEKVVKTADGLAKFGTVNKDAILRVISAIKEVQKEIDFSSHLIKAVSTEAMRRASNGDVALKEIEQETGVHFEIISGVEEARLTLLAVKNRLNLLQNTSESFVLVDIGGGSTELIFQYRDKTISNSFPIGIVTIAQSYENIDAIEHTLPQDMLAIQNFIHETYTQNGLSDIFVATAGTPTTVAAMKLGFNYQTYDANKVNGTTLHKEELDLYLKQLISLSFEEREIAVGTGRSDLIAAGILIYKQIFTLLDIDTCVVIDDGLREGVALDYCLSL